MKLTVKNEKVLLPIALSMICAFLILYQCIPFSTQFMTRVTEKKTRDSTIEGKFDKITCKVSRKDVPKVFSRGIDGWHRNKSICSRCFEFKTVTLRAFFASTPICIYDTQDDKFVSPKLGKEGVFDPAKLAWIYTFMKFVPEANLIDIGANIGKVTFIIT